MRAALKANSTFSACSDALLDDIATKAVVVSTARGETIYRHGEPGNSLLVALSGSLKVTNITADGKEVIIAFLGAGALVGEIAVLDGHTRTANVVALEKVESALIYRRDLMPILRANPDGMLALIGELCARLRGSIALIESYALETEARVAACLLRLAGDGSKGTAPDAERIIELRINQREIGSYLGLTRETVSRTLSEFRSAGLVEMRGPLIAIVDVAGLQDIAGGLSE